MDAADRVEGVGGVSLSPPASAHVVPPDVAELADASPFVVFRAVGGSPWGITEAEAAERLASVGENVPTAAAEARLHHHLVAALRSPFAGLLLALGAVLAVVGSAPTAALVLLIALCSVGLRLAQRLRSARAVRVLRSRTTTTALVRRRGSDGVGREHEVPIADLVPGDVVVLAAGDLVPADVRLLSAEHLLIDQSVLTGELLPVAKDAPHNSAEPLAAVAFSGSTVVRGTATGVVVGTGARTHVERLSRTAPRPPSTVEVGVRTIGWTLVRFMLVLAPVVLLVNGTVTGDWTQAVIFAVAVAVGLTPELLPIIVTTTLARGATRLHAAGVLVTRLDGIQDLGGIDVLCLDKTGTLTEARVVFTHAVDVGGQPSDLVATHAHLAAHFQTVPLDTVDEALDALADRHATVLGEALHTLSDELPFDHERRRSTVLLRDDLDPDGPELLVTKGDPDLLLPLCATVLSGGVAVDLDAERTRLARATLESHRARGMRVLAIARRRVHRLDPDPERDLELLGFVGFVDPVRAEAAAAVTRIGELGVSVKVLTGDAPLVAERVAGAAGIACDTVLTGDELDAMDDDELAGAVAATSVFARLAPHQKTRVVAALRTRGHAVGFIGDGVNDVDALRCADVGIAVAGGAEAARAAADLVLLNGDLGVVAGAVEEGRRTLGAATRYSTITAGLNLGNAVSVVVTSAFLPFLPMLPAQLILQNLLYNAVALALPFDRTDAEYLRRPRRWHTRGLLPFMLALGGVSTAFDLATFGVGWFLLGLDTPAEQQAFQAVWFVEGMLSQVLVLLVLRGRGTPRPPAAVVGVVLAVAAFGVLIPWTPIASLFDMAPIPIAATGWLVGIVACYLFAVRATVPAYVRCTAPRVPLHQPKTTEGSSK